MKRIIILSAAAISLYAISQVCGCGSCSQANAQPVLSGTEETFSSSIISQRDTITVKVKITGITCAGCSNHVTQTLLSVNGVSKVELEYPGDVATVEFDASKTKTEDLIAAVEKINYKAEVVETKNKLIRIN